MNPNSGNSDGGGESAVDTSASQGGANIRSRTEVLETELESYIRTELGQRLIAHEVYRTAIDRVESRLKFLGTLFSLVVAVVAVAGYRTVEDLTSTKDRAEASLTELNDARQEFITKYRDVESFLARAKADAEREMKELQKEVDEVSVKLRGVEIQKRQVDSLSKSITELQNEASKLNDVKLQLENQQHTLATLDNSRYRVMLSLGPGVGRARRLLGFLEAGLAPLGFTITEHDTMRLQSIDTNRLISYSAEGAEKAELVLRTLAPELSAEHRRLNAPERSFDLQLEVNSFNPDDGGEDGN